MEKALAAQLTAFNQTYKEIDGIYHSYAKKSGLSDAGLWVLYSLWERGDAYTQRELSADWSYSPQTVNSVLKSLEQQGLIQLAYAPGNRKSKQIHLTQKGLALGERVVTPLMQAERSSFSRLDGAEREALLSLTQKHIMLLRQEIGQIGQTPPEDRPQQ